MKAIIEKLSENNLQQYLLTKWSTNETLLQYYRTFFISSQSIIIAVGAILVESVLWFFVPIFLIGLYIIWGIWYPVVKARQKIVDYYKYSFELKRYSLILLCSEKEYVNDESKRNAANKFFSINKKEKNWRKTRRKVDRNLPILFTIIWIILLLISCIESKV